MIFEHHVLTNNLRKHLESVFYFKDPILEHSIERVVPTGHIFILFELDGFTRTTYNYPTLETNNTFTKAWISGVHENFISISAHEKSEMLVIQFKPTGSFPFLHLPAEQLKDKIVPAEEVLGNEVLDLRTKILHSKEIQEKFRLVEGWLLQRFEAKKEPPSELLAFVERIQKDPAVNLNELISSYPCTQKQLIEHFKKYIGLAPKYYQRILRFNDLLQKINRKEKVSWAEIAYDCGYSDQSHFIKEFSHFSGFKPQEFIHNNLTSQDPNFFPIDKKG